jgi:ankyrin repeat-rich membrane spanning protein
MDRNQNDIQLTPILSGQARRGSDAERAKSSNSDEEHKPLFDKEAHSNLITVNYSDDESVVFEQTAPSPHMHPLTGLFQQQNTLHRNHSDNFLQEYSSEMLLLYTKEANYFKVKDILDNTITNHMNNETYLNRRTSVYNTITSMSSPALKKPRIDLEIHDEAKQTPLIIACRLNSTEICHMLIAHGADVNASDADSWTPLLNAAKNGNGEIVEELVKHKATVEAKDIGGFSPLMWACYKDHVKIVRILLKNGANPNSSCKNQIGCLSWAAGRGYDEVVAELLKCYNIRLNLQDSNNSTPLLWAARKGSLEIVRALVERGASPEHVGMNNMNALLMSCRNGHLDAALYLSRCTNSVNHTDKDGHSALSLSAKNGYTDLVLSLLEKGAYVNRPNKKGDSILITAVRGGHKSIIDALLAAPQVEIDAVGNQGKTALHHAIEKANLEVVRALLFHKPDLEIASKEGDTPLLLAAKKKSAGIVNELLNNGSKVSPTDKNGDNCLHISLRNRSREMTELILSDPKNSKYLYKPNKHGETPYKIDASNPKSILIQVFGASKLTSFLVGYFI